MAISHKNPRSLDSYAFPSQDQQRSMSKILSGKTMSTHTTAFTEHKTNPFQASSSQQSQ